MIFHPAHSFRHTTNATHDSLAGGLRVAAPSGYCLATLRVDVLRASQSPAKSCGMFKS